jgi:hypothetical protein
LDDWSDEDFFRSDEQTAQEKAPGSPALTPANFQIIALHILDPEESRTGVQLIAITNFFCIHFCPVEGVRYVGH